MKSVEIKGNSYFSENAGGTVIRVAGSDLFLTGNLTIKNGRAFRGGGIQLDGSSKLFLKEPLEARFYDNHADQGSAIFAPVQE